MPEFCHGKNSILSWKTHGKLMEKMHTVEWEPCVFIYGMCIKLCEMLIDSYNTEMSLMLTLEALNFFIETSETKGFISI